MFRQLSLLFIVMVITLLYSAKSIDKKGCIYNVTIIMMLFSGLRTWWSGDLIKYYSLYRLCTGDNWKDYVFEKYNNIGLRLMFKVVASLGGSYEMCIFFIAAFSAITLGMLIYRYSPSPYWSYLMYITMGFYLFTFSGLKQTIAMGFITLAMMALIENKLLRYVVYILLGGFFHAPAMIFFIAFPFAKFKLNIKFFLITAVFMIMVFLFRNQVAGFLSEMYYSTERELNASEIIGGRALMMIFIATIAQFLRPVTEEDTIYRKVFGVMILALIAQFFSVFNNVFTRLADYFFQFVVLYIPLMLEPSFYRLSATGNGKKYTKDNDLGIIIGLAITAFSIWYYTRYINASLSYINSIKFFWEIDAQRLYNYGA